MFSLYVLKLKNDAAMVKYEKEKLEKRINALKQPCRRCNDELRVIDLEEPEASEDSKMPCPACRKEYLKT